MAQKIFLFFAVALTFSTAKAELSDLAQYATKNFLISTAPTGCMPKGIKADPQGKFLYVAEMCGKVDPASGKRVPTASIYDLVKRSLYKTLITPIGARNGIFANTEVEFSLDKKWAFISRAEGDSQSEIYKNSGLLSVVNRQTQKIAKFIPTRGEGSKVIAARPFVLGDEEKRQILYVANYFSDNISVLDISDLQDDGHLDGTSHFLKRIHLVTNFGSDVKKYFVAPRGIAFTPDGKYGLILATETGSLIIVDAVNHKQIAELAPMPEKIAGRQLNVRHIVISKNGKIAYLSHMRGNAVSRINIAKLVASIQKLPTQGSDIILPPLLWNDILIPFNTPKGPKNVLVLEDYPKDHPNFPQKKWNLAHPNTIVLDPKTNRYLYVSFRTTSNKDYNKVDPRIKGKIDIIDTQKGTVIISLVGGAQPTALEVTRDGNTLISSGFVDERLYFFDLKKILSIYEAPASKHVND